ncbi:hypothetical protein K402DRAFT_457920 [Aulographum hederae CBS 113979]|uniref:F-box domain-containing protein n=1 Tax=Aulographum hederae CBS 113979 TaxID=1176131 RepID=A0A6G1GL12_9PEZI|nr:hypothetical protein K402DRAFT_457920 [Aulographum hederae CBS 113979]
MHSSLGRLPYDIVFDIALYLGVDDAANLAQTCGQLSAALNEESLCRKIVELRAAYTLEASLARDRNITYRKALLRIWRRRRALSEGRPSHVSIVGIGSDYVYNHGVLVYLREEEIFLINNHGGTSPRRLLNIKAVLRNVVNPGRGNHSSLGISLLYYCEGILTLCVETTGEESNSFLVALSTSNRLHDGERILLCRRIESTARLFARHNSSYLYYGTHSIAGTHGHREWVIRGICLGSDDPFPDKPRIQLFDFVGSDVGSTVAFTLHEGYFYAVSNQTSFEVEEVDWTSFYHCVRFPLNDPRLQCVESNDRIYRRQHSEGPVNDSWIDLGFKVDEATNELVIGEARREWRNGGSQQTRTFYTSRIHFAQEFGDEHKQYEDGYVSQGSSTTPSATVLSSSIPASRFKHPLPDGDPFVSLLTSTNNPHYAPIQTRIPDNEHHESNHVLDTGPTFHRTGTKNFILARTKLRAYNGASNSFIDLVEDDRCCTGLGVPIGNGCLRLRISSRKPKPLVPLKIQTSVADGKRAVNGLPSHGEANSNGNDDGYTYSPITMYPPLLTPLIRLQTPTGRRGFAHDTMNPHRCKRGPWQIKAQADERSVVYLVKPASAKDGNEGEIVCVMFDPDGPVRN